MTDLHFLAYSAVLAWIMVMLAGELRLKLWTRSGLVYALGNRDAAPPEPSPLVARAERAARNMLENLLIFACVLVAAHLAGGAQDRLRLGSQLFFFARLAYFPIYVFGIPYVRTLAWAVSLGGIAVALSTLF